MNAEIIFKRLKFSNSSKALIINAPEEYKAILSNITYDKEYKLGAYDFIQVFAQTQAELEYLLSNLKDVGKYDCLFWICYPKGGGKIKSDLKRDVIWKAFELVNLRPVAQIAIDETWSALRGRSNEMVNNK